MAVLGSVEELIPSMVDEQAVSILRKVIDARAEVFFFDCKLCGAERPASVVDPGVLMFRDYTCADVSTRCTTPPSPKAGKRFVTLRPGSLVFAPIDPEEKTMWPGIIEDCPDGTDAYMIPGKTPNKTKAYFVTFIFPKDLNRKWLGGYIAAEEIRPLEQPCNTQAGFGANSAEYNKSVQIAYRAVPLSLKERILKFSFVAHVASQRNIKMNGNSPDFWSMFAGKRKSSSTEESPGSPKEAAESVPSYSTKLPKLTLTFEDLDAEDLTMVKSEHAANPEHTKPVAKGVSKPEESADHSD